MEPFRATVVGCYVTGSLLPPRIYQKFVARAIQVIDLMMPADLIQRSCQGSLDDDDDGSNRLMRFMGLMRLMDDGFEKDLMDGMSDTCATCSFSSRNHLKARSAFVCLTTRREGSEQLRAVMSSADFDVP